MDALKTDLNSNISQRPKEETVSHTLDLDSQDKLEVEELARGLKVRSDKPHLVSLGGGRLSTAVTLLPLDQGVTRIGSDEGQHIRIYGADVQGEHCYIENTDTSIALCPLNGSLVSIDGERVNHSTILTQGCMLCLGRANYFRFNHPEQAMKLKGNTSARLNGTHCSNVGGDASKGQQNFNESTTYDNEVCSPTKYRDDLVEQSFRNKLKHFETLTAAQEESMSPPPTTPNLSKFSYLNYVGEKLFTRDTNTTRLSADGESLQHGVTNSTATSRTDPSSQVNGTADAPLRPPKPDIKPKPSTGKAKPMVDNKLGNPMASSRTEFKTLSMISTETSIWGSTSSTGTVRAEDDFSSPFSCTTPVDDSLEHPDVFNEEMTDSLTLKHQQMIEERKLEEAMEKKEQERLEEILAMCAQYEEQIDSEKQISAVPASLGSQSKLEAGKKRGTPPNHLDLSNICTSNYEEPPEASVPTQLPDVLGETIHSMMSASFNDRRNIKTNGSLIQSPTSPPRLAGSAFNYNNNSSKAGPPSHPTISLSSDNSRLYQDDSHLYDCPADYDLHMTSAPAVPVHGLVVTAGASAYEDDARIYDAPADVMVVPPPIPSHNRVENQKGVSEAERLMEDANKKKKHHRSVDSSSSSELTVVSSSESYKTAVPELSASFISESKPEEVNSHLDSLRTSRAGVITNLQRIKFKIMELETQQSESVRELEMEQALLQGEQQSELNKLQAQWEEGDMLKSKRLMAVNNYTKQQHERIQKIEEAREKLQRMEERRVEIEEQLRVADDEDKDELLQQYENELDALEGQKKLFEDLEFQQLEMEAKYEEENEAMQRELNGQQTDLVSKIKKAEDNLASMTKQQTNMMEQTRVELDDMERQRKILVAEFQREKQRMMSLDHKMKDVQRNYGNVLTANPFAEPDESLLVSPAATLNRALLARMKPGDILMEEERRRLESLKHAATEASIMQWHEQRNLENNLRRFNTLDSEEENMSTRSSETPSDGDKNSYNSSMDDQDRFSELQLLLAQARHHVQNAESADLVTERKLRIKLEQQLAEEKSKREELVEEQVQLREKNNPAVPNMRPLTRYLPVREEEFDLRSHVESTGHNLGMCPFVTVTPTQCKGYLLKMGSKLKTWNKRWFVFDREKKALLYYMDKSEAKPRGGIYFQSIEDVFVDHMRNVKSPNQKFTFCVKTYDKPYYLVAKSPEALSIWIDVIFTGAEGYQEF